MLLRPSKINLSILLLLLLNACSVDNPFIGRWESIGLEGEWISFSNDKTFEINTLSNDKITGTYSYKGNVITLTPNNLVFMNGEPLSDTKNSFTAELSNDELNMSFGDNNRGVYRRLDEP